MAIIASRRIRPDPTDELVMLYDKRVAEHAVLSGAIDKRMAELSALRAEVQGILDIAATVGVANGIRESAEAAANESASKVLLRERGIDERERALDDVAEAQGARKTDLDLAEKDIAARATAFATEVRDTRNDIKARKTALETGEAELVTGKAALAKAKAELAKDRKTVNARLAALALPE